MNHRLWKPAATSPTLGNRQVHLWRIMLDLPPTDTMLLERLLSADEHERAERMHSTQLRERFGTGRGMLRTILSRYLACDPADLRFQYGEYGKPALAEAYQAHGIQFNLAHSAGLALLAITQEHAVGVDVEAIVAHDDLPAVAKRFFAPAEQQALWNLPEHQRLRGFYECWVRKEAVIKLVGDGLTMPLDSFVVSLDPDQPAQLLHSDRPIAPISLAAIDIDDHYTAALAVASPVMDIAYYDAVSEYTA
jgi:4'-phosphopantetheinyl transferase